MYTTWNPDEPAQHMYVRAHTTFVSSPYGSHGQFGSIRGYDGKFVRSVPTLAEMQGMTGAKRIGDADRQHADLGQRPAHRVFVG